MDSAPEPRPELTAAQRIAIALGTAEPPPPDDITVDALGTDGADGRTAIADPPA